MKKFFKIIKNIVGIALLLFLLLVVGTFIPIPGNYKIFTVQSGSMEPAIHPGSLIFVMPRTDYKVGDIVTRKTNDPKVTVTHRIIEITESNGETAYITQGDANNAEDPEEATQSQIIGREIFSLPYIGYPIGYARTAPGFLFLVIIPAVIIIYEEANKIKREIALKFKKRKEKKVLEEIEEEEVFQRGVARKAEEKKRKIV